MNVVAPADSELTAALRRQILDGRYRTGDRIPTEAELAREFNISIRSVRSGIDDLVAQNLLVRRQGSGTYVRNGQPRQANGQIRNTYAMILPLVIRGYHPFFSELLRGIREGIEALGYAVHGIPFESGPFASLDIGPAPWSEADTLSELSTDRGLRGLICGGSIAGRLRADFPAGFPIVAADENDVVPYVAYDWRAEVDHAVRRQIAAGACNIWVYGGQVDRQAWALLPEGVTVRHAEGVRENGGLLSSHIRHAFEQADAFFSSGAAVDGVVVASDFESQGVLDAAVKCGINVPGKVRFTCIVNRESHLVYPFPLTVQIADGYLKGRRLVDLLHQQATTAHAHPQKVILRCEEAVYEERTSPI